MSNPPRQLCLGELTNHWIQKTTPKCIQCGKSSHEWTHCVLCMYRMSNPPRQLCLGELNRFTQKTTPKCIQCGKSSHEWTHCVLCMYRMKKVKQFKCRYVCFGMFVLVWLSSILDKIERFSSAITMDSKKSINILLYNALIEVRPRDARHL